MAVRADPEALLEEPPRLRTEVPLEFPDGPRGVLRPEAPALDELARVREVALPLEAGVLGVGLRAAIG